MQSLVLDLWKETGKTIILITHSVEEALLLGEQLLVMAPRPGRVHKEYRLPFADLGVGNDLREVKKHPEYASRKRFRNDLEHGRRNHGPDGGKRMTGLILVLYLGTFFESYLISSSS